jgi:hypothetical protein
MGEGLFKSVFHDKEMADWFSGLLVTGWFGSAGALVIGAAAVLPR